MSLFCRSIFSTYHRHLALPFFTSSFSKRHLSKPTCRSPINLSLYLIADRPSVKVDDDKFLSRVIEAVKGGVTCVQLRDYVNDAQTTIRLANLLKTELHSRNVTLIINCSNLIQVVKRVIPDGVFLEQTSVQDAQKVLGNNISIGIPIKSMEDLHLAEKSLDIDYMSIKVFPSKWTNPTDNQIWQLKGLQKLRSFSKRQFVAIGGITLDNAHSIYQTLHPDDGIAMAGDLLRGDDPYLTAQKLKAIYQAIHN